jgi:rhodanese-related sulfurtransferase
VTVHASLILVAAILGGGAAVADGLRLDAMRPRRTISAERDRISAVALAESIVEGRQPRVFDLRSGQDFDAFHVPSATHVTLEDLDTLELPRATPIVVYADGAARAAQAWTVLRRRGYRQVSFLGEGVYEWIVRVHEPQLPVDATDAEHRDFEHRAALSRFFGGQPHLDVPRADLARGYWTADSDTVRREPVETSLLVAAIRRRGC